MAMSVKDTPELTGEDAKKFEKWLYENEGKKISPEEFKRIQDAAKKFRLIPQD